MPLNEVYLIVNYERTKNNAGRCSHPIRVEWDRARFGILQLKGVKETAKEIAFVCVRVCEPQVVGIKNAWKMFYIHN